MWNAKRVLILFGGLVLFGTGYLIYAYFLGGIDGMPPLPRPLWPSVNGDVLPIPETTIRENETDRKLREAFGRESKELKRPIRLDLNSKRVAISAGQFEVDSDGRVKMTPFSAAMFPNRADGKYPEINTIKCEFAFLTFDQPVTNLTQVSSRKVIGVELKGSNGVTVINNRRTPEKHDDLELFISGGPVIYEERRDLIWTDGWVQLEDYQTRPRPTKITARGMELQLAKDSGPNRPKTKATGPKNKGEGINGVELLVLRANVEMHLYIDPQSGFLSGAPDLGRKAAPAPKGTKSPGEKSHVVIKTNGAFTYDLIKDFASFDSPPANSAILPTSPEQVSVMREHKVGKSIKNDQLLCDHLELQFRRKVAAAKGSRDSQGEMVEIESALATAPKGKLVLTIDSESLEAYGTELHYRAPTAASGPQTILKGSPLHAVRESHKLEALELHIIGPDKQGQGQQVLAKGPGQIDLFDKTNKALPYPMHAFWKDSLILTKDKEGDRSLDLLTLIGDAAFVDDQQKQELTAQRLQVWLVGAPSNSEVKVEAAQFNPVDRQKPHKIEAFDRVGVRSPDILVRDSHHLVIRFKEETALEEEPSSAGGTPPGVTLVPGLGTPNLKGPAAPAAANAAAEPAKQRKPIELKAKEVVVYIAMRGAKKELKELVSEGGVHVTQESSNGKDKGVDIQGEMLNVLHDAKGDILYVFGDARKPAQLQLGEVILIGPKVIINQRDNVAEIEGTGAMQMPSNTTFDGGRPTTPGTRMTIYWTKDMDFNGKYANFRGGVQAIQDNARMLCDSLEVVLDKAVSFKEGQKGSQTAKVEKLLCDRKVFIEDKAVDPSGKLVSAKRLEVFQLDMDNQTGTLVATGPGKVNILALGDANLAMAPAAPKGGNPKQALEMKGTLVTFETRMWATTKEALKSAKFYDNVEVYHAPADKFIAPFNLNAEIPKNGMYLKCDRLHVLTRPGPDKKSTQGMIAEGRVLFETAEYQGNADVVRFDESQDVIILEGTNGNTVTLTEKPQIKGGNGKTVRGSKILYNRRTGQVQGGIQGIQSMALPVPRSLIARLHANRQDDALFGLGLGARDDG